MFLHRWLVLGEYFGSAIKRVRVGRSNFHLQLLVAASSCLLLATDGEELLRGVRGIGWLQSTRPCQKTGIAEGRCRRCKGLPVKPKQDDMLVL